jgi:hypothetical protein
MAMRTSCTRRRGASGIGGTAVHRTTSAARCNDEQDTIDRAHIVSSTSLRSCRCAIRGSASCTCDAACEGVTDAGRARADFPLQSQRPSAGCVGSTQHQRSALQQWHSKHHRVAHAHTTTQTRSVVCGPQTTVNNRTMAEANVSHGVYARTKSVADRRSANDINCTFDTVDYDRLLDLCVDHRFVDFLSGSILR